MANYKRVVSYMYVYRNQLKGNNVGFARIEIRDSQCKITVHIRVPNMKDQEIRSYIYCWSKGEMRGVFLGNVHMNNGVGELTVKVDSDNLMNSKYRMSEMNGILLYVSDTQYIACNFEEDSVIFDKLHIDTAKPNDFYGKVTRKVEEPLRAAMIMEEKVEEPLQAATAMEQKEEEPRKAAVAVEEKVEMKPEVEPEVEEGKIEELDGIITEHSEPEPEPQVVVEQEVESKEDKELEELKEKDEVDPAFPLSKEKIEELDKQAQELFGTMLLDTLFPPKNTTSEENTITEEIKTEEKQEEKQEVEQPQAQIAQVIVNPKSAIECFKAFRSCESEKEYQEIQEEIQTMKVEIEHLELLSKEWKIKQERIKEMKLAREESEMEKRKIEQQLRKSYNIIGVDDQLEVASTKMSAVERIFNKYPKMDPFVDQKVVDCIKIEPQDLGIFPMENWILANNSFLLHGYYSYRHLIFMMEKEEDGYRYYLGVPGVNYSREQFMANMFGFNKFKQVAQNENETAEFGYWCYEIIM